MINKFETLQEAAKKESEYEADKLLAQIKNRYRFAWWESLDPYVIFENQLREQVLLVSFGRLMEAADLVLGRQVLAHEFYKPEELLEELYQITIKLCKG